MRDEHLDTIPRLRMEEASLSYHDGDRTTYAVRGVSLQIPAQGFTGVMGPSGSGKSSLLYLLAGLKRATEGTVRLDSLRYDTLSDRDLARIRRERFGFVFQQPFLLNYLTARENVLAAAPAGDRSAGERVDSLLESLGVAQFRDSHPYQLSGGERQRVCVARAMINEPQVIFADEPTAALDHANGHIVVDLLTSYRSRGSVVIVTHDPEMLSGADHVFRMRDGILE